MFGRSAVLRRTLPVTLTAALIAAIFSPVSAATATPASGVEFFVSPTGANGGDGSEASPYGTLEAARDAVRAMNTGNKLPAGGATITLREGVYERDSSFTLDAQDSGTETSPIVYRAYPGEDVRLNGGRVLDGDDFTPAGTDGAGARLNGAARSSIVQYDLGAAGITDLGGILQTGYGLPPGEEAAEIFFNGDPMTIARFPNGNDFAKVGQVTNPGGNPRQVVGGISTSRPLHPEYDKGLAFKFSDDRPKTWASTEDAWMYGYWYWDWADGNLPIDSIDAATNTISTKKASHYSVRSGQRYYYYNIPEELDTPGEYYLDRAENVLYFYPPAELAEATIDLSLLTEPVVKVDGASHVTFSGLQVDNSRGDGIVITSGDHNRIEDSTVENLGGWGVRIEGGVDNIMTRSEITRTGHGGIFVSGGDRPTLTRANNAVTESTIHNFSRLALTYNPGVMLSGVGNTASDNHIYNAPHQGIAFEGNDHLIEYNEVRDVVNNTSDSGAIYSVRDWSWTGTVIRYNYVHDIGGPNAPGHDQEGIYLDDLTSGITVYGNVLQNIPVAFMIGGGRSNTIENNIVLNSVRGMSYDARGMSYGANHCAPNGGMQKSLEAMPYKSEPWASHYPWLVGLIEDQPCIPKNSSVQRNVFKDSPEPSIDKLAATHGTVGNNLVTAEDLRFVDEANGDLTLTADSPVFAKVEGFETIPFERMHKSTFVPPPPAEPLEIGLDGWTGKANPSTEQVHTGKTSHAVLTDREVLTHVTDETDEATATVWFWDDAQDTSMRTVANVGMGDSGDLYRALGVSTSASTFNYVYRAAAASFIATEVPRTTGWHKFEWVYGEGSHLEMKIDDTTVATFEDSPTFDRIQLGDWWDGNGDGKVFFDTVSIDYPSVVEPEPTEVPAVDRENLKGTPPVDLGLKSGKYRIGETVVVHGAPANQWGYVYLNQHGLRFGWYLADADGTITFTVPAGTKNGKDALALLDRDGARISFGTFHVTP